MITLIKRAWFYQIVRGRIGLLQRDKSHASLTGSILSIFKPLHHDMKKTAVCCLILLFCSLTHGGQFTAGVAHMPLYAESADEGVLINFVKALSEESGREINIQLLPFSRSMQFVKNRQVDFHLPLIKAPYSSGRELDYDYSTATIFHVNFVLYDNKDNPVDLNQLDKYTIETDTVHKEYFDFKIRASACMALSLIHI